MPDRRRLRRSPRVLACVLTPLVRRVRPCATASSTDRMPAGSTRARSRGPAAWRSRRRSWSSPAAFVARSTSRPTGCPTPLNLQAERASSRCSSGGAAAAVIGVLDDLFDLRARWQLARPARCWRSLAVALGIGITRRRTTRSAPGVDPRSSEPFSVGFTVFWIVGMINSINWIDGLDGLSTGIALIAARHAGADQPHDAGQPAAHRGPVLRPGGLAGRVPALELPPGHRSSAGRAACCSSATRWRCCRSSARPRSRSRCSCSACRSSTRSGSSSGGWRSGGSPFAPDRSHIHHRLLDLGLSHRHTVLLIYGICVALGRARDARVGGDPALRVPRRVHRVGLILFGPTRGAFAPTRRSSRPRRTRRPTRSARCRSLCGAADRVLASRRSWPAESLRLRGHRRSRPRWSP